MKHILRINVADKKGKSAEVLQTRKVNLPKKIIERLFGELSEVVIFTPGKTVLGVEICEKHHKAGDYDE